MSALTIAILGGLGAMVGWGLADFFAKVSIDDVGELPSLVWGHAAGTLFIGVAAVFHGVDTTDQFAGIGGSVLVGLAFFGALQAAVYFLLYTGFAQGQVAVLSPTFASFSGLVALVSILFLDETATLLKVVALIVIAGGILALSFEGRPEGRKFLMTAGFGEVLLATVFATGWTLGWDRLINGRDPVAFALLMYAFTTIALLAVALTQRESLRVPSRRSWVPFLVIGLGEATAYLALSWAYSETSFTSVVAVISGAFSLPTIVLASIFLRERLSRAKVLGALLVIGGAMALALQ